MTLLSALAKYGVGSVGLLYLIWKMADSIPALQTSVQEVQGGIKIVEQQHDFIFRTVDGARQEAMIQGDKMLRLLTASCVNQSENKEERERCLQ